jgi:hypothetical protein
MRNEIETKQNETKRNRSKRNEIYRNETKSKQNEINRNEIDQNETKQRSGIIQNEIKTYVNERISWGNTRQKLNEKNRESII